MPGCARVCPGTKAFARLRRASHFRLLVRRRRLAGLDRDRIPPRDCDSFRSPAASGSLLFVWPKRSNQEKGHPATARCAPACAQRPLRCSPASGRRITRTSLCSDRFAFPRMPAALLGAVEGDRRGARSCAPLAGASRQRGFPLWLAARRSARLSRGPYAAAGGRRTGPQGRAHDGRAFVAGTGTCPQRTPQAARAVDGQESIDRGIGVSFPLVTFVWISKRK